MADVHCTVRHWRLLLSSLLLLFFFNDTATTEIYTLSLHDALPILSTLRTRQARVFTVDVFALDFSDDLEDADGPMHGSELDTSLLLYIAPELVRMERAQDFEIGRASCRERV